MFPTYTQMLKRWGAERPNHIAVIYEEKAISYSELLRDVQGLAVALQSVGVNEGDRVAVLLPTGLELITTILAIPWIGALYVPVNPKFTPVETSFILQQTQAKVLICTSDIVTPDYWAMFESVENPQPALEKVIAVGKPVARYHVSYQTLPQNKTSRTQAGDEVPYSSSSISDDFAIVYTSGTTGAAKGILVNQFSGISTGHGIAEALKLRGDDVLLSLIPPISYINLCCSIPATMSVGATLVLPPYPLHTADAVQLMQDANVNFVHGVPTHFVRLLSYLEQNEEFRLQIEQLKAIGLVSGAACSPQVIRKVRNELGIKLCNHYGLAEFGGVSVVALDEQDSETIYESVGKPFDWVRLAIVDASIEPVSQGTVGEVLLQGPGLMKAYYGQHKETRKKITSDGWLRTADLGMLDKNGNLRLVGRSSDMIIRCGNNVYPIEIETTLREHPQVFDAVAFGLPDIELGESICACIVPRGELDASAIFEFLSQRLVKYKLPDNLVFVTELSTNVAGKVLRRELRQRVIERQLALLPRQEESSC